MVSSSDDYYSIIQEKDLQSTNSQSESRTSNQLNNYTLDLEQLVKKQKKQLKEAERMAAIGQTAGMIGHDIRNPLQAILNELYLAKSQALEISNGEVKNSIQESMLFIEEQIAYINKIVCDLQDYARPLKPEIKENIIQNLIQDAICTITIPKSIRIKVASDKHMQTVKLDDFFTKRVLVNLLTNAIQAMPNGGIITIKTFPHANNAIITVEDTGVGIPDEVRHKIFTPLFTTKSKGQGFGLAVAKRLIEVQGGTINFESEKGKGTKFIICFPVHRVKNRTLLDYTPTLI
ncbi:MAG: ATP-binding protein [Candidatus Bathyarchaeota archaeon]|nr:ATP-binding protein [Candidatus Bathyarchaeota archaeon]